MVIVAKDGNGSYTDIQAAVDALPETGGQILVRAGEYREKLVIHKDHVFLKGEDRDRTVIAWNGCAKDRYEDGTEKGTFLSATLMTTGRDVICGGRQGRLAELYAGCASGHAVLRTDPPAQCEGGHR